MTRIALLGLWALLSASVSHASAHARAPTSDLTVDWQVPAQLCPDREELRSGLSRRLGREVRFGADAPLQLSGRVFPDGAAYVLELHTRSKYGVEQRSLRARTCNELARASVLIAALLFGREPPSEERDTHAEASQRDELRPYVRAQLALDLGTLPGLGVGPSLMLGARMGRVALELGGFALLPSPTSSTGPSEAALQLTAGAASGCVTVLRARPVSLAPCLQLEAGALHAEARQVEQSRPSTRLWMLLGLSVRSGVELSDWLYWFSELGAGMPWDRAQFVVGSVGEVHRIPSVVGRFTTGLESRF